MFYFVSHGKGVFEMYGFDVNLAVYIVGLYMYSAEMCSLTCVSDQQYSRGAEAALGFAGPGASWSCSTMVSAEREAIWGSGGEAPSGVQGQSPWSGVRGRSPPEAGDISRVQFNFDCELMVNRLN